MEEEGSELIEYMCSTHELLKRIYGAIGEYQILREEVKNVEISKRAILE